MPCPRALALLALPVLGCVDPADQGPMPLYEPGDEAFFDAPWPSDARMESDGTVDLSGFPNAAENDLLKMYIAAAEEQTAFSTNGPVYFRFRQALDTTLLPDPIQSVRRASSLVLFDIDPHSPHWGERFPVWWHYQRKATHNQPANLLAVSPLPGFPLRPATTYALVVTTEVAARHPELHAVWEDDHPDHAAWADLEEALFFQGLTPDEVAVATVFTTADPLDEMARLATFVKTRIAEQPLSQEVRLIDKTTQFRVFRGGYQTPVFQHGDRPYADDGGGLVFRDDGMPVIHSWDPMRLAISAPYHLDEAPPDGWPVVVYAHGTGGDYLSFVRDTSSLGPASQFTEAGLIGIGFDMPLHGTRVGPSTNPELHSFNLLNPVSARANFRQGGVDGIYLAHLLATQDVVFTLEATDEVIRIDRDKVLFMGHSHGALTGALALPWMGEDIDAAVLSAAGGLMAITVMERKNPIDFAELVETLGDFSADEEVNEFHPVLALIQWMVDVTDPINYAPYWYHEAGDWHGTEPLSVLLTSGLVDTMVPYRTAEALAAAGRLPQVWPGMTYPEAFDLRELDEEMPPLAGNATAWDESPVTAGFSQWSEGNHYTVFEIQSASDMVRDFLHTAADGAPTIDVD